MTDTPEPRTEEALALGCTCLPRFAGPYDTEPPEPKIDPWCSLHGKDPDWERDKRQDHMR